MTSFDATQALWTRSVHPAVKQQKLPTYGYGTIVFENIATGVTSEIRVRTQDSLVKSTLLFQQAMIVQVQWGCVVVPIVFTILCLVFIAMLICQCTASRRTKTWKFSTLVVLHALGAEKKSALCGMKTLSALKDQSKCTYARLENSGDRGWGLRVKISATDASR